MKPLTRYILIWLVSFSQCFYVYAQKHRLTSYIIYRNDTINKVIDDSIKVRKWMVFEGNHVAEEGWYGATGKKIGEWKKYYRNGTICSKIYYEHGEPYGIAITYDSTGKMRERGFWAHDKWIGNYDLFYEDGNIQHRFTYGSDGKRTGFSYYYWNNGFISILGFFSGGAQKGGVEYDSLGRKQDEVRFDSLHQMLVSAFNEEGKRTSDTVFSKKRKRILEVSEDSTGKFVSEIIYDTSGKKIREGKYDSIGEAIVRTYNFEINQTLFNSLDTLVKEENGIVMQRQNLLLSKVQIEKQKRKVTLSILGILLLVVITGFYIRSSTQRKKSNLVLAKKNAEIEQQKVLVEEKNKDILDSITYAKRLQDAILPPLGIIKKYLPESFVLYKPKDIVAGDFYWMERAGDTILIAACDCTGHGVPGAMVSVVCSNALNRTVKEFKMTEPGKVLDKVRELVLETFAKSESEVKDGMDISLASLNPSEGVITISWAGAYNSLWYIENGILKEVPADKQPIGMSDNPKPFTTHTITLTPPLEGKGEAAFYLFTDGYADQFGGPKGKKFKYKQLQQLLVDNYKLPMPEQEKVLEKTLNQWKGSLEQVDDVLVIGIRV